MSVQADSIFFPCTPPQVPDVAQFRQALSQAITRSSDFVKAWVKVSEDPFTQGFLSKSLQSLQRVDKLTNTPDDNDNNKNLVEALQLWCTVLNDITYIKETQLVDNEFSDENCLDTIHAILQTLENATKWTTVFLSLTQSSAPAGTEGSSDTNSNNGSNNNNDTIAASKGIVGVLGVELAELLHWRPGALLYMYCATEKRKNKNAQLPQQLLKQSLQELTAMLELRNAVYDRNSNSNPAASVDIDNSRSLAAQQVQKLIEKGLYSDTHVLALIYAGEVCVWLSQQDSTYRDKAKNLLTTYIDAVNTSLPPGWNTDNTQTLLREL